MSNLAIRLSVDGQAQVVGQLGQVSAGVRRVGDSASTAARESARMSDSFGRLKVQAAGLLGVIGAGALAREFILQADAMKLLDARLKAAVGSGGDLAQAQRDIYSIAQQNNVGLKETAQLYNRLAAPVQRLGGTVREVSGITNAFALALRVGGASAQEAASATLQFAQAMGSGRLQGDEFRAMAEASPRFLQALADGMGQPIERLKEMGSEGKLTADVVGNALLRSLGQLREEAQGLPDTVGGALTRLQNEALVAAAAFDSMTGAAALTAETVGMGADWVTRMTQAVRVLDDDTRGLSGTVDISAVAFGALGTILETVVLIGSDVAFTLKGVGREIGGVAAQAAALLRGDLQAAGAIRTEMIADAERSRAALDKFQASVSGATAGILAQRSALRDHGLSAAENRQELARLARHTAAAGDGFRTLKSSVAAEADESKKAAKAKAAAAKELASALAEYEKARADELAGNARTLEGLDRELQALRDRYVETTAGRAVLDDLVNVRIEDAAATHEQMAATMALAGENELAIAQHRLMAERLREQIVLRKAVASATASKEADAANAAAAKAAADEWQRASDQVGQSLADALMQGGKSAAEYIKGLFRTMVLRPIIQAVTQPAANAVLGLLGMGASGSAAAGGSSAIGSVGSLASSLGAFGGAFGTGMAYGGASGLMGGLSGAGALLGTGNIGMGLGAAAGALGPYALGAAAVYSLLKGMDRSGTPHRGSVVGVDSAGMASTLWGDPSQITRNRDAQTDSALAALGQSASGLLNSLSRAAGGAGGFSSVLKFASDNTDPSVGGFNLSRGGQTLSDWGVYQGDFRRYDKDAQAGFEAYTRDVVAATRGALDQIDLPNWAREQFRGLEEGADLQALAGVADSVAQTMDALRGMESGLRDLGGVFASLAGQGSDALYQVAQLAGGMDALSASTGAYFSAYYTDAERAAIATQSMTASLAEVGIALPASREAFRQVVDGLDVSTEAGRRQFVAMMQVAGAFAEVTPAATTAAETVTSVAETMRSAADILREREGLETQLLQLQGDTAALRALELASLDPSNRALQERIYALQDEQSAAEVAAQELLESAQQQTAIASERAGLEMELLRLQGDTAAIRAIERAALDESNRALYDQVNALRDLQAAADIAAESTAAAAETARANAEAFANLSEAARAPVTAAGITASAKAQIEVDSFRRTMDTAIGDLLRGSRYPQWTQQMIEDPIAQATGQVRADLYATGLLVWQEQQRLMMDAAAQGWASTDGRLRQPRGDQGDDPRQALLREQVQGTQELIDSLDAMRRSMIDLTNELIGGELDPANPADKYASEREFVTGLGRQALTGDMAAAAMFREQVGGFLQMSQGFNASSGAYAADFSAMIDLLTRISASMERQQGTAEATLSVQQAGLSSVAGSTERTAQATAAQARTARVLEQRAIE